MKSEITIPHVGPVNLKIVAPIVIVAGAYVGYRYYVARQTPAAATDTTGSDFGSDSTETAPSGTYDGSAITGIADTGSDTTTQTTNNVPTTNAEWTNLVADRLGLSGTWADTDILTALGNYLTGAPLTALQKTIVQAAIAVGGDAPVGSHPIISGGDTPIIVAPTGLHLVSATDSTVTIGFSPVPGATAYQAFRGLGYSVGSSTSSTITVSGLKPSTTYKINVAAVSAAGKGGPESAAISVKTAAAPKPPAKKTIPPATHGPAKK